MMDELDDMLEETFMDFDDSESKNSADKNPVNENADLQVQTISLSYKSFETNFHRANEENEIKQQDAQCKTSNSIEAKKEGEDTVIDTHPYLYWIDNFEVTKDQMTITDIGPAKTFAETPLHEVSTRQDLIKLLETLRNVKEISLDLHWDDCEYKSFISLLEISTREADYIVDAMKLRSELLLLTEILINPQIVKILYKAETVLSYLQQTLRLFVINIFDVEKAVVAFQGNKRVSLMGLLKQKYSFERDTKFSKTNFRARPIPDQLKEYCRASAHYLIHLYHDYKNQLLNKSEQLYEDVLKQCRDVCRILFNDPETMFYQTMEQELKNRHECELDVLRQLYDWRNDIAQKKNKKPEAILNKTALLNIATYLPVTEITLFGFTQSQFVRQHKDKVIGLVKDALAKHQVRFKRPRQKKKKEMNTNEGNNKPQMLTKKLINKFECNQNKQANNEQNNVIMPNKIPTMKRKLNENVTIKNKIKRIEFKINKKGSKQKQLINNPQLFSKQLSDKKIQKNDNGNVRPNPFITQDQNFVFPANLGFNNGTPNLMFQQNSNANRRDDFSICPSTPKMLKPTNVPSTLTFQTNPPCNPFGNPGAPSNVIFQNPNPLESTFVSGGLPIVKSDRNLLNGQPGNSGKFSGNFNMNKPKNNRYNNYDQDLNVIDQKISTLEKKVIQFQSRNFSYKVESNSFRRKF